MNERGHYPSPKFKRSYWTNLCYGTGLDAVMNLDGLMPSQWQNLTSDSPERLLLVSILAGAVNDLTKKKSWLIDDVEAWVLEEDHEATAAVPFSWLCLQLQVDEDYARRRLLAYIAEARTREVTYRRPHSHHVSHGTPRRRSRVKMGYRRLTDAVLQGGT